MFSVSVDVVFSTSPVSKQPQSASHSHHVHSVPSSLPSSLSPQLPGWEGHPGHRGQLGHRGGGRHPPRQPRGQVSRRVNIYLDIQFSH